MSEPREMLIIIRPSFRKFCDQDSCRAALYNHILYRLAKKAKSEPVEKVKQGEVFWFASAEDIHKDIDQTWSINKVRQEINNLIDDGILGQRHNPLKGWDRKFQYFLSEEQGEKLLEKCNELGICLLHLGLTTDVLHLLNLVNAFDKNGKCICQKEEMHSTDMVSAFTINGRAIPKGSLRDHTKGSLEEESVSLSSPPAHTPFSPDELNCSPIASVTTRNEETNEHNGYHRTDNHGDSIPRLHGNSHHDAQPGISHGQFDSSLDTVSWADLDLTPDRCVGIEGLRGMQEPHASSETPARMGNLAETSYAQSNGQSSTIARDGHPTQEHYGTIRDAVCVVVEQPTLGALSKQRALLEDEEPTSSASMQPKHPESQGTVRGSSTQTQPETKKPSRKPSVKKKPDAALQVRIDAVYVEFDKLRQEVMSDPTERYARTQKATDAIKSLLECNATSEKLRLVYMDLWNAPQGADGFSWQDNMTIPAICRNYDARLQAIRGRARQDAAPVVTVGRQPKPLPPEIQQAMKEFNARTRAVIS